MCPVLMAFLGRIRRNGVLIMGKVCQPVLDTLHDTCYGGYMTMERIVYAPGERSTRSGRWAADQPPSVLGQEHLPLLRVLDASPPATWMLDQLTRAVVASGRGCDPEQVEHPDARVMLATLAAVEYRGGALIRGSSRRDLQQAAVVTGSDVSRAALDAAVAGVLQVLGAPATVRQILRRRQGLGTARSVRGALDRLRAAGRARWLATDPVPWGMWELVPDAPGVRGPASTAVLVDDPAVAAIGRLAQRQGAGLELPGELATVLPADS